MRYCARTCATFSIATRNLANTLGVPVETIIKHEKEATDGTQ